MSKKQDNQKRADFMKAAQNTVLDTIKDRRQHGSLVNEADLITGAVSIMQLIDVALFDADQDRLESMPYDWFIRIIRGESITGEFKPANKVLIETEYNQYGERDITITEPRFIDVEFVDYDTCECDEELEELKQYASEIKASITGDRSKYYVVAADYGSGYGVEFGSYDKKTAQNKAMDMDGARGVRVLTTTEKQSDIEQAVFNLNNEYQLKGE